MAGDRIKTLNQLRRRTQ